MQVEHACCQCTAPGTRLKNVPLEAREFPPKNFCVLSSGFAGWNCCMREADLGAGDFVQAPYFPTASSFHATPVPDAPSTTAIPCSIRSGSATIGFHQSAYSSQ